MFRTYYDLKNPDQLPKSSFFVDPYDNYTYKPEEKEPFLQFVKRIHDNRQTLGHPDIPDKELRTLILVSLAETASERDLRNFFTPKALLPEAGELVGLAKTILKQRVASATDQPVSYLKRQSRASKCLGCRLHQSRSTFGEFISKTIEKVAGIKDMIQSEKEKALGTCGACGCGLQAKVKFDIYPAISGLQSKQVGQMLRAYGSKAFSKCWILDESLKEGHTKKVLEGLVKQCGPSDENLLKTHLQDKLKEAVKDSSGQKK